VAVPTLLPLWHLLAGSSLYPRSLLTAVFDRLAYQTYGNPHSSAAATGATAAAATSPSMRSEEAMQQAAAAVLQHLNADPAEYQVIFTRWATLELSDRREQPCMGSLLACGVVMQRVGQLHT
jgi:selenocysteine lyase/cysteine desulfurase